MVGVIAWLRGYETWLQKKRCGFITSQVNFGCGDRFCPSYGGLLMEQAMQL